MALPTLTHVHTSAHTDTSTQCPDRASAGTGPWKAHLSPVETLELRSNEEPRQEQAHFPQTLGDLAYSRRSPYARH